MLQALRPSVQRLLEQHQLTLTFVDVGSRNGILELRDLASAVRAFGFEPNPEEYAKLLTGKTDHAALIGDAGDAFQDVKLFPYALSNVCGRRAFHITPGAGACGLLEPDLERLREIVWKGRSYENNFGQDIFAGFRTIDVEVRTLDAVAAEQGIRAIDYLKIDVEGSEYEVLEGAKGLLPQTGVIKVETGFTPFRKDQKLFSHVDLLLRDAGFDLLKHEVSPMQVGYKVRTAPIEHVPFGGRYVDPYAQPLLCDAIYVNRRLADPARFVAQAIILMERNYLDEALHVLRTRTTAADGTLSELLRTLQISGSLGQRLRRAGYGAVDAAVSAISRAARALKVSR